MTHQRRLKSSLYSLEHSRPRYEPSGSRAVTTAERAERDLEHRIGSGIASGHLRPGDALPPERELAKTLSISRGVLRQALASLESRGLVQRAQGRGNFISSELPTSAPSRRDGCNGDSSIRSVALLLPSPGSEFFKQLIPAFEGRLRSVFDVPVHVRDVPVMQSDITNEIVDCLSDGADAFVITPSTYQEASSSVYRMLRRFEIPFVSLIGGCGAVPTPMVRVGSERAAAVLAEQLLALGHRHAGVFAMHGNNNIYRLIAKLDELLRAQGGKCPESSSAFGTQREDQATRWRYATAADEIPLVDRNIEALADDLRRVLDSDDPPTVLFAGSNALAEEIYLLLLDQGVRVPQNVCLVGYGSMSPVIGLNRRLAALSIDTAQMGEQAAELLIDLIRGDRPLDDPHTSWASCTLDVGFSLTDRNVSADTRCAPRHITQ